MRLEIGNQTETDEVCRGGSFPSRCYSRKRGVATSGSFRPRPLVAAVFSLPRSHKSESPLSVILGLSISDNHMR